MNLHIPVIYFHVTGLVLLFLANSMSALCIFDNFSKGDKSGLGSILFFIPILILCGLGALLTLGFGHNLLWVYVLPALVMVDVTNKLAR